MGVVNLFADMTYEGGASINGQFRSSFSDHDKEESDGLAEVLRLRNQ
jgi:hypothetical protein